MRNGQSPELAKGAIEPNEAAPSLDVSIKKPLERAEAAAEVEPDLDQHDFSSSSFKFEIEHTQEKPEPARRIQTFPKLEQERPREAKTLTTNPVKTTRSAATQTKVTLPPKTGRRARGTSLLDRYISFLAKILKAIEKFILRHFNRGQGQQSQHTQEAAEGMESLTQDRPKKKKLPIGNGPGI